MSAGADSCGPESGNSEVVFVESGSDGMSIAVRDANVEDVAVLHSDAASTVVNQTLSDIPYNSAAEAFDCDTDLSAVTTMSVAKENDSLQASINQLEKQNAIVCKLIRNGVKLLLQVPASLLSLSASSKLDSRSSKTEGGQSPQPQTVTAQSMIQSRSNKPIPAAKITGTKRCKCSTNEHAECRRFKCSFGDCKWAFTTKYKLQRHMEVHEGHKTFVCHIPDCGKTFSTVYNLRTHIKLHDRVCNEACQMSGCEAKFSTRRLLENHIKEQHPADRPYSCSYPGCGMSFAYKWNLMSHRRKHLVSSESLQCQFDGCGRRFDRLCRLQQHQYVHTGQRPFACPQPGCSWSFTTSSKLQRHLLRHSGQKQWVCPHEGCGKAFRRREHVRGHMSTHSDLRPYSCSVPGCSAKFKNKSSLFAHKRRHDSKTPEVENCGDMTDVAAYASVIASSASQSVDSEIMTSHGLTFRDLETGAFYLQTQLLQDDPPTPEMCDFDETAVAVKAEPSSVYFSDLDLDDYVYTATTINLHDLE